MGRAIIVSTLLFSTLFVLGACSKPKDATVPNTVVSSAIAPGGVAWLLSKDEGSVAAAFALANRHNKPLFLYWGATWCPPCNQVKSTIFTRADFVDSSRAFVPVYLDGDTPSAQKLGKSYRVSGYPTMILFRPDGSEITRLAGEVDPAQYIQLLKHGLSGGSTAKQALIAALAGNEKLSSADWRLLAYYSWHTSEQALVDVKEVPKTLAKLAAVCPLEEKEAAARLRLKAIAAAGADSDATRFDAKAALAQVMSMLGESKLVRSNHDVFVWHADDLAKAATKPKSKERAALVAQLSSVLDALAADTTLSTTDRVGALGAKVALAKLDNEKGAMSAALLAQLKDAAVRADRETTDVNERQSVINTIGYALREAGLMAESDALYKAELARSHSPYYYMSGLASNARQRGDRTAAIDWAQQAYDAATGPATRLQWGASLIGYLTELAPEDAIRIEKTASGLVAEAAATPDAFFARNRSSLNRISTRMRKWNESGKHNAVIAALRAQVAPVCATLPAEREGADEQTACKELFVIGKRKT